MIKGMVSRVDKIEQQRGLRGPGFIWLADGEDLETAHCRYLELWPDEQDRKIKIVCWAPATPS